MSQYHNSISSNSREVHVILFISVTASAQFDIGLVVRSIDESRFAIGLQTSELATFQQDDKFHHSQVKK